MNSYVDLLAHKNPGMKIVELGAGTGGMTSTFCIESLRLRGRSRKICTVRLY